MPHAASDPRTEFAVSGAARLACSSVGSGPDVVFLHAGVADRRAWAGVMGALADQCRSVAYDRRGFGDTTSSPEVHSWTADLLAVLDHFGTERPVLVGNSQGGRIAIDLTLSHPQRVSGLVLIGTAVHGAPEPAGYPSEVQRIGDAIEAAEHIGDLDELNELEAELWLDGPLAPVGRVGGAARELFLDMNLRALGASPVGEVDHPPHAWPRLESITVPTLVVVGLLDLPHLVDRSRELARRIPGATLVELPGVAHLPALEVPAEVARLVGGFMEGLAGR